MLNIKTMEIVFHETQGPCCLAKKSVNHHIEVTNKNPTHISLLPLQLSLILILLEKSGFNGISVLGM